MGDQGRSDWKCFTSRFGASRQTLITLDHVINAISLFWTSFFSFLRLEFHFVAPESARKKIVRMDGRTGGRPHRIWPDLEAPGTTPRTTKKLPVTARSSQKETHKCSSNSLKKSTNRAPPALLLGEPALLRFGGTLKEAPAAQ